jgi:eukaryotic-like serine/threonine-protein kinase
LPAVLCRRRQAIREREIFDLALTKADPVQRCCYLDEACGGDETLRHRLQVLIDSHDRAESILDTPIADQFAPTHARESNNADPADSAAHFSRFTRPRSEGDAEETRSDEETIDLSFLQQSQKPGMLGRLEHYEVMQVLGQGGLWCRPQSVR